MDVTKIKNILYQYTDIDDCTKYRVLYLYPRKTSKYTLDFIDSVIEEMPFPIQTIRIILCFKSAKEAYKFR